MQIYNCDDSGCFIGESEADESPLEEGVFLIPALATTIPPPEFDSQHIAVFNGETWDIKDISLEVPKPDEPSQPQESKTQAELLIDRIDLMQKALDDLILNGGGL